MARTDNEIRVTPSVLDRLIDLEPNQSHEAPKSRSTSVRELKSAVRRDLEWLLNTRCFVEDPDEQLDESRRSVAFYGLPDFTGMGAKSSAEQKQLTKMMETAINNFEPRFLDLRVTLQPISEVERQLKFHVEARLDIEPTPEPIAFDTVLQMGSGDFAVIER
jgi:type VI secretion system protein ImpF